MNQKILQRIMAVVVAFAGMIYNVEASSGGRKKPIATKPSANRETKRENSRMAAENDCETSPLGQSLKKLGNAQSDEILEAMKHTRSVLVSMCKSKTKMESADLWHTFEVLSEAFPRISRHGLERYNAIGVIADLERTFVPKLAAMPQVRNKAKQKVDNLSWVIGRSHISMPKQFRELEDSKRSREQRERLRENLLRKVQWSSFVSNERTEPVADVKKKTATQTETTPRPQKPRSSSKKS